MEFATFPNTYSYFTRLFPCKFSGYLKTSPTNESLGEVFGVVCWLWIFYRARQDLPVLLGWRHPWEHGSHDDHHDEHDEH